MRHADAEDRDQRGQPVENAAAKIAGDEAEEGAEAEADERGERSQDQRIADGARHLGDDRAVDAIELPRSPWKTFQSQMPYCTGKRPVEAIEPRASRPAGPPWRRSA
jgi:hypothetical protein